MQTIKNVTGGPKGVNTADGSTVYLAPDEARELDLSEGELASAKATGHFEFGGKAKAKDPLDHDADGKKGGSASPEPKA